VGGENGPGLAPWNVALAVVDVLTPSKAVAAGVLGIPFVPGEWHTLRLVLVGAIATGFVDGAQIFTGLNVSAAPAQGWVGFGTPRFGDLSQFGAYVVLLMYESPCQSHRSPSLRALMPAYLQIASLSPQQCGAALQLAAPVPPSHCGRVTPRALVRHGLSLPSR